MREFSIGLLLVLGLLALPVLAKDTYYVTKASDTLESIAADHGISSLTLLAANPELNKGKLYPGQMLRLPETRPTEEESFYSLHRVSSTEDLDLIAANYHTDARTLVQMNPGLKLSVRLEPGSVIFVPNPGYKPADQTTAYNWEKFRGHQVYKRPEPVEQVLASLSPGPSLDDLPQGDLEALPGLQNEATPDELNLLAGYAVNGGQIPVLKRHRNLMVFSDNKVIEVPTRGQVKVNRRSLASRRGRRIYSLLRTARSLLGIPYVWGGESATGADCSGYVQLVFARNGVRLPRTADIQFEVGRPVRKGDEQPGDLVFFETYAPGASHVGIYAGKRHFLHASSGAKQVTIGSLDDPYFKARYLGARRHL